AGIDLGVADTAHVRGLDCGLRQVVAAAARQRALSYRINSSAAVGTQSDQRALRSDGKALACQKDTVAPLTSHKADGRVGLPAVGLKAQRNAPPSPRGIGGARRRG